MSTFSWCPVCADRVRLFRGLCSRCNPPVADSAPLTPDADTLPLFPDEETLREGRAA